MVVNVFMDCCKAPMFVVEMMTMMMELTWKTDAPVLADNQQTSACQLAAKAKKNDLQATDQQL